MFTKYTGLVHISVSAPSGSIISARCPACRQAGTFDSTGVSDLGGWDNARNQPVLFGQRKCPNPKCRCYVFIIRAGISGQEKTTLYPPEAIDFDATDIPAAVSEALDEGITCHSAGCYVASAIMVRKSLELLCVHQGVTNGNLKQKIAALGTKITVSQDLLDGLDHLRLLGNDAAHVTSDAFHDVGEEEVVAAIELAKELLRATYQHKSIVARLAGLRKKDATQ